MPTPWNFNDLKYIQNQHLDPRVSLIYPFVTHFYIFGWLSIKPHICSYFVSSVRLCSLMLTMTQYIKEEGSCKRTKFALRLTFLPDKFYYHLSVKDYTGLNLQWCPLFKWILTTFHTFGTICLRKHIFWMSIASDWSLKDRIPIFVLHIKIILFDIHF